MSINPNAVMRFWERYGVIFSLYGLFIEVHPCSHRFTYRWNDDSKGLSTEREQPI